MTYQLMDIARQVRPIIEAARADGLTIDDGNLADNIARVSLNDLRDALVVAGLANQFPKATSKHS